MIGIVLLIKVYMKTLQDIKPYYGGLWRTLIQEGGGKVGNGRRGWGVQSIKRVSKFRFLLVLITSLDFFESGIISVKSFQMVRMRRWMIGD